MRASEKLVTVAVVLLLSIALLIPAVVAHANAPSVEESKLIEGINEVRQQAGIQPLAISAPLSELARTHLQTGSSVFGLMRAEGMPYRYACSIRAGTSNVDLLVRVLTRSSSSQALSPRYDQAGVAIQNNRTVLILIGGSTAVPAPTPQPQPEPTPQPPSSPGYALSAYEAEVVRLVNAERARYGLKPLEVDFQLAKVARLKSEDMRDKGYFSHTSPTYGSPFQMMREFGITYRTAGENIAAGHRTPAQAMQGWMNSPGHRANILNANFTHIGVGYAEGGSYGHYWTQMFTGR